MKTLSDIGMRKRRWLFAAVAVAFGGLVVGACRNDAPASEAKRSLTVFAASSLRDAFTAIAVEYQRTSPNVVVTFNFAGTQELRAQLEQGAHADVFAGADVEHAAKLERQGLIRAASVFAENEPVLVIAEDMAATIASFAQLQRAKRVVLGAAEVPIGRYSGQILDNATKSWGIDFGTKIQEKVVSRELNVKQVLAKVALGEADAGIVYRTDVSGDAHDTVVVVDIPAELNVLARYPIALLAKSENAKDAQAWIDVVSSERGRALLTTAGFRIPPIANGSP